MTTDSAARLKPAEKPQVIVLGDCAIDCHSFDNRAEDSDQWLAWTSPLSRDDWHYSAGFDMRQCLAGAAAIHGMLWRDGFDVAGNSFPVRAALLNPQAAGPTFGLRKRANAGKSKECRTRAYLKSGDKAWSALAASGDEEDKKARKNAAEKREETWRAAASFLSKSRKPYVRTFDPAKHMHVGENVTAV